MSQRGGIITGFLIRTVIVFAVLGLCVYEAGAIIVTTVAADQVAREAAREAAVGYAATGSTAKAKRECVQTAKRSGATCESLTVDDGHAVARVRKEAPTVIADRIGFLRRFTVSTAEARARIT